MQKLLFDGITPTRRHGGMPRAQRLKEARERQATFRKLHPERDRETRRAYALRNRERIRARRPRYWKSQAYEITPEILAQMSASQRGACGICGEPFKTTPHIDHDHKTGFIRGLLCRGCNQGLGHFADDPVRLIAAVRYLFAIPVDVPMMVTPKGARTR